MPLEEDSIVTLPEDQEALAAEEAAFASSFATERGDEPVDPVEPVEPAAPVEPAEPVEPVEPAEPAEPITPAEVKLFAGLTEDQLQAALARSGTLQTTVDKMAGRIGQIMQQIESLRSSPPTTQAAQQALDLKLEKLSAAFPELAGMLREDLQGLQGGGAALAPAAPAGITQEQLDAALGQRLSEAQGKLQEQIETRVLTVMHPDWMAVIKSPQFALWRDNVLGPVSGKLLMESEDSAFISQNLSHFKEWRDKASAPPAAPTLPASRTSRIANAVLPAGRTAPAGSGPITEEDAFNAAFSKERKTRGY